MNRTIETRIERCQDLVRAMVGRREWSLLLVIVSIVVGVACVDPGFLSMAVWSDIVLRCAPTAIVACGLMLVVVTGEIDISVGSLMALLAALLGRMLSVEEGQLSPAIGIPVTLLAGAMMGLITGTIVTRGHVPSIVTTLGLLTALRGITTLSMGGKNIGGLPESLVSVTKQGPLGVPLGIWTAAVVVVATAVLIYATPLGRRLYALGSSPESARFAGLSAMRLKMFAFAYTGFLTALATVVDVPRLPKIESGIGVEFELLVVTCVVVGGVSVSGGRGRLAGVLLAVVLMTMLRPVLTFLAVGEAGEKWTKAIQGLFIVLAIVSDRLASRRAGVPRPADAAPSSDGARRS